MGVWRVARVLVILVFGGKTEGGDGVPSLGSSQTHTEGGMVDLDCL